MAQQALIQPDIGSCWREKTLSQRNKDNFRSLEAGLQPTTTLITHSSNFLNSPRCSMWPQGPQALTKPAMCSWRKIIFKHLPLANNFKICSHYKCKYSIENEMLLVHLIVRWIFSIVTSLHLSLLFTTHVFMYVFLSLFLFLI